MKIIHHSELHYFIYKFLTSDLYIHRVFFQNNAVICKNHAQFILAGTESSTFKRQDPSLASILLRLSGTRHLGDWFHLRDVSHVMYECVLPWWSHRGWTFSVEWAYIVHRRGVGKYQWGKSMSCTIKKKMMCRKKSNGNVLMNALKRGRIR